MHPPAARSARACVFALLLLQISLCGCRFTGTGGAGGADLGRFKESYPDLASGRFTLIARFEDAGEELLFRKVGAAGPSADEQPAINVLRSRRETGVGSLRVTLAPGERLLLDGQRSSERAVPRDWRPYTLLIFSLHASPQGARLQLAISGGGPQEPSWSTTLTARAGWNLFRVDTAEIADALDLADVRAVEWRLLDVGAERVELYLDDVVLADNTRVIRSSAAGSELYVFEQGRRVHVGAAGRFEVGFADGLIVAWKQEGAGAPDVPRGPTPSDNPTTRPAAPRPARNLTVRSGLGPWVVPLERVLDESAGGAPRYDDPGRFGEWGAGVRASQYLAEVSAARVVVDSCWRFAGPDPGSEPAEAAHVPSICRRYSIYPTGRIYVHMTVDSAAASLPGPFAGFAIAVAGDAGFRFIGSPTATPESPTFALLARSAPAQADLLWVTSDPGAMARQVATAPQDDARLVALCSQIAATPHFATAHLLQIWPLDTDDAEVAASLAADYQNPATVSMSTGELRTQVPGDLDTDGFNESEGCYEIGASGGAVRFIFEPAGRTRFDPVFRVHGVEGRRGWVYADGRIIRSTGLDSTGRLLFRLPVVTQSPVSVEVLTRASGG